MPTSHHPRSDDPRSDVPRSDDPRFRGTGRTTRQIRDLPPAAVYIWCDARLDYPRRLCIRRRP